MRKLAWLGCLTLLAGSPAFAQFEGGVNGLGDARSLNMPTSEAVSGTESRTAPVAAPEEQAVQPAPRTKIKKKKTRH
jgi:hypothetical protein